MTIAQKKLIRRLTLAAAAAGLLVPVTVSPGQGIDGSELCASGTCCRELNSVCTKDGVATLHHYQAVDRCTEQELK